MERLSSTTFGIHFPAPVLLASGVRDETGASMKAMARAGAGGITTKSIGPVARNGNPLPAVVEIEGGLLNSMGLPNPGIDAYGDEVRIALEGGVPLIGSVFGPDPEGFASVSVKMASFGVSAIELNLSCPNAQGTGISFGQDPAAVREVVERVRAAVDIPVLVKLTPQVADITTIGRAAVDGGADGIVAVNTMKAMSIDVWSGMPVLANHTGGLSGPALRPVGVRCVWELASDPLIKVPIIGVGGITTWKDAVEYLLAGASLVAVGTALLYRGPGVFREITEGLLDHMDRNGYTHVEEMVGRALDSGGHS